LCFNVVLASDVYVPFVVMCAGTAVLQLLEHIPRALLAAAGPAAAAAVLLFYLSAAAPDALATASSCCEYLEEARKQAVLFNGQAPFEFDKQLESGQLRMFTGLSGDNQAAEAAAEAEAKEEGVMRDSKVAADYQEALQTVQAAGPCVVFVPLWSLAAGGASDI
jgi:hypothetical protein